MVNGTILSLPLTVFDRLLRDSDSTTIAAMQVTCTWWQRGHCGLCTPALTQAYNILRAQVFVLLALFCQGATLEERASVLFDLASVRKASGRDLDGGAATPIGELAAKDQNHILKLVLCPPRLECTSSLLGLTW